MEHLCVSASERSSAVRAGHDAVKSPTLVAKTGRRIPRPDAGSQDPTPYTPDRRKSLAGRTYKCEDQSNVGRVASSATHRDVGSQEARMVGTTSRRACSVQGGSRGTEASRCAS